MDDICISTVFQAALGVLIFLQWVCWSLCRCLGQGVKRERHHLDWKYIESNVVPLTLFAEAPFSTSCIVGWDRFLMTIGSSTSSIATFIETIIRDAREATTSCFVRGCACALPYVPRGQHAQRCGRYVEVTTSYYRPLTLWVEEMTSRAPLMLRFEHLPLWVWLSFRRSVPF